YGMSGENSSEIQTLLLDASNPYVIIRDKLHEYRNRPESILSSRIHDLDPVIAQYNDGMDAVTGRFILENETNARLKKYILLGLALCAVFLLLVMYRWLI